MTRPTPPDHPTPPPPPLRPVAHDGRTKQERQALGLEPQDPVPPEPPVKKTAARRKRKGKAT